MSIKQQEKPRENDEGVKEESHDHANHTKKDSSQLQSFTPQDQIEHVQQALDELEIDFGQQSDQETNELLQNAAAGTNGSALASVKLSSKKKEALSQVPCKFFRSNGCSAGNACPFAHSMPGEGAAKAVCQWYLKGNCRFGHRCALAHILPGQPMSMDRKNKRAAQQQQQNGTNNMQGQLLPQQQQSQSVNGINNRSSTQRTGMPFDYHQMDSNMGMHGNGDLMFGLPDDLHNPQQMNAKYANTRGVHSDWPTANNNDPDSTRARHDGNAFDGINMPSTSTMMSRSPAPTQAFGTSPFSHPGSNSVFFSGPTIHDTLNNGSGAKDADKAFGRSFGRIADEDAALRAAVQRSWNVQRDNRGGTMTGREEEHAEEFLPSSLSDLLTPAELERRRRSVLASKNSTLSGAVNGHSTSSQSMPANGGLSDSLNWAAIEGRGTEESISSGFDPIIRGTDRATGGAQSGTGTTRNGFLSSGLQSDLTRSRDAWGDSGVVGEGVRKESGERSAAFSPNFQAVLSHAPGQSLPQGLAAGLSRLHLRSAADPIVGNGVGGNSMTNGVNVNRSRLPGFDGNGNGESFSPGVIGGARSSIDDLGPTVPSSIFNQRNSGLQHHFGRSIGGQSNSTSFEAGSFSRNQLANSHGSPHTLSPAIKAVEGGIAIPSNTVGYVDDKNGNRDGQGIRSGSVESRNSLAIGSGHPAHHIPQRAQHLTTGAGQHPGIHRVRTSGTIGGGIGASPLSLPTTGEEVEEAIFELE